MSASCAASTAVRRSSTGFGHPRFGLFDAAGAQARLGKGAVREYGYAISFEKA